MVPEHPICHLVSTLLRESIEPPTCPVETYSELLARQRELKRQSFCELTELVAMKLQGHCCFTMHIIVSN